MVDLLKRTTISLSTQTKNRLDLFKVHHRESYEDLLNRLCDQIGLVPICVYDWYDDKGPKKEINTLGRASFPEWCPLEDVE